MIEVSSRTTARIPIVQFKDPQTGFDCDISFNNPLAIANTKLLKTYSEIDSRVLPLAFIIKHWAKSRLINSPGDGTLSSYGYIICLIHFLQHRPIPVLPKLQQIPPDWDGNSNFRFGNYNSNEEYFQRSMLGAPFYSCSSMVWCMGQCIPYTCGITQYALRRKSLSNNVNK